MFIGVEFFFEWLEPGRIENDRPILQNIQFGCVIAGSFTNSFASTIGDSRAATALVCSIEHCDTLNKNLQQFWTLENYWFDVRPLSEKACDVFSEEITSCEENGQFIVQLSFCDDPKMLDDSRDIAYKRLM